MLNCVAYVLSDCAKVSMSKTDWQSKFDELNRRYFSNKLPHYTIQIVAVYDETFHPPPGSLYLGGCIIRKARIIKLLLDSEETMEANLLHEMAHAATNDYHGPKWRDEMRRLRLARAPVHWDIDDVVTWMPDSELQEDRRFKRGARIGRRPEKR